MPMTLGYWDIRGLAHAIRLLLEYTDSSYEEKRYTMGDGGETEEEKIRVDILENQAMDVSNQLARVCYSPDFVSLVHLPPYAGPGEPEGGIFGAAPWDDGALLTVPGEADVVRW
ncbi:glutathione S-transferase Mu 4 isoform X6 [Rattus norvegicus]|uniref:glutathione S-transferase Mu 4 isoform X6 n=1 Tax=Rattus norvegicus TaxID=10116 RepID=UPI002FD84949